MKIYSIILFLVIALINCKSKEEKFSTLDNDNTILERVICDLNSDGRTDTMILSGKPIEFGEFTKITFSLSNGTKETIKASDSWDKIDSSFLLSNKNSIESKRIFLYKGYDQSIILLFGFEYGIGRTEISLIRIQYDSIKLLSDRLPENLISIGDLNNDGNVDIIGRSNGELLNIYDSLNAHLEHYNPYQVYSIDANCKINEQITKEYNEKHYVFAGYYYDDKILVFCKNDKSEFRIEK